MKKTMKLLFALCLCASALIFTGCRAVTVENYGEEVAVDAEGKPVTLADGKIQTIRKGWRVHHNQHWMATDVDSIEATVKPEEISFALGKTHAEPSQELGNVIDKSLGGLTKLVEAVGAAYVKIAGGGAQADVALSTAQRVVNYFRSKGGDPDKATVSTDGDLLKLTDGTTCVSCDAAGNCTDCSL